MARILGIVLLAIVLLLALIFASISFAPQSVLDLVNKAQQTVQVSSSDLNIGWLPLNGRAADLRIRVAGQVIEIKTVDAKLNWRDWFDEQPFWQLEAAAIVVTSADQGQAEGNGSSASSGEQSAQTPTTPLADLFAFKSIQIDQLVYGDVTLSVDLRNSNGAIDYVVAGKVSDQHLSADGVMTLVAGDAQALDISMAGSWQQAPAGEVLEANLGAAFNLNVRARLDDQFNEIALQLSPSLVEFSRASAPSRQFDIDAGNISWATESARLQIEGLSGNYLIAGDAQPYSLLVDGSVTSVFTQPEFDLNVAFADSKLTAVGQFDSAAENLAAEVDLRSQDLPSWLPIVPYEKQHIFPLALSFTFSGGVEAFTLADIKIDSPANVGTGRLSVQLDEPLSVVGEFAAERWFVPLVASADEAGAAAESTDPSEAIVADDETKGEGAEKEQVEIEGSEEPLFSGEQIDWSWLTAISLDLTLSAQMLSLQQAEFSDFSMQIGLADGLAKVKPLQGTYGEGGFTGDIELALVDQETSQEAAQEAGLQNVRAMINYEIDGVTIEQFGLLPPEELEGGEVLAALALIAEGGSPLALASTLAGDISLRVDNMQMRNNLADLAGSDVLVETLNRLNPFRKEEPATQVECGVFNFDVTEGVLKSRKIVVETSKMRVTGNARVNLPNEDLNVTFSPSARSGIGVSVGSIVKFVKLGGKLRDPGIEVDALGLLQSGAAISAAISTGGMSVLAEGLAKKVLSRSPCSDLPEPTNTDPALEIEPETQPLGVPPESLPTTQ